MPAALTGRTPDRLSLDHRNARLRLSAKANVPRGAFLSSAFLPNRTLLTNQSSSTLPNACALIDIRQRLAAQTSSYESGLVG